MTPEDVAEIRRRAAAVVAGPGLPLDLETADLLIWTIPALIDEIEQTRALAGHRTQEPHGCFEMNCRGLGDEVERLREALVTEIDGFRSRSELSLTPVRQSPEG